MVTLVSIEDAKRHLRLGEQVTLPESADDRDLQLKLVQATAIVLDYIQRPDDEDWTYEIASWTSETVPAVVQAAILLQVSELYRFRGDDVPADVLKREHGYLSPAVVSLLHRYRDPVVA